ncbi:MAG: hypothetical protein RR994_02435 [Clostridia bacterium]
MYQAPNDCILTARSSFAGCVNKLSYDGEMPMFSTNERAVINPVDLFNTAAMTAAATGIGGPISRVSA